MSHLWTAISSATLVNKGSRIDDDFVDRLHYKITAMTLMGFAIGVCFKQFGGRPIECALSSIADGSDEEYIENFCWAQDTYFVPWEGNVPVESKDRRNKELSYYQWVPFFLLIQMVSFQIPYHIWRSTAAHSGIRVHMLVREAVNDKNLDVEVRRQTIMTLRKHIENGLRFHRRIYRRKLVPHPFLRFLNLPYGSCYVTTMYLFTKILYTFNVFLQFRLLNAFMLPDASAGKDYSWYGFDAFRDLLNGTNWGHSGMFPRVTMCDFTLRKLAQQQTYSVQCVLVINMLNEKIFIFLWVWYLLLGVMTLFSLSYWTIQTLLPCCRRVFVVRQLELSDMPFDSSENAKDIERFTFNYLHSDGVFILRMITAHAGVMMGTDLAAALYRSFYDLDGEGGPPALMGTVSQAMISLKDPESKASNAAFRRNVSFVPKLSHASHATCNGRQWPKAYDVNNLDLPDNKNEKKDEEAPGIKSEPWKFWKSENIQPLLPINRSFEHLDDAAPPSPSTERKQQDAKWQRVHDYFENLKNRQGGEKRAAKHENAMEQLKQFQHQRMGNHSDSDDSDGNVKQRGRKMREIPQEPNENV